MPVTSLIEDMLSMCQPSFVIRFNELLIWLSNFHSIKQSPRNLQELNPKKKYNIKYNKSQQNTDLCAVSMKRPPTHRARGL